MKVRRMVFLGLLMSISLNLSGYDLSTFQKDGNLFFKIGLTKQEVKNEPRSSFTVDSSDPETFGIYEQVKPVEERFIARDKVCFANIRTMLGAVEMYNMDYKKQIKSLDQNLLKELVKGGYLRKIPNPPTPRCKYTSTGDLTTDGKIICSLHGNPDEPRSEPIDLSGDDSKRNTGIAYIFLGKKVAGPSGKFRIKKIPSSETLFECDLKPDSPREENPSNEDQWQEFHRRFLREMSWNSHGESLYSYVLRQLDQNPDSDDPLDFPGSGNRGFGRTNQGMDLYSLTTGGMAIQESLQLDRMNNPEIGSLPAKFGIEVLKGPDIKSHPFVEMIGNRQPKVFPIEELVPEDFYSLHFTDINREIALSDLLDQWGTSLLQAFKVSSRDSKIKEKLLKQLCLEMSDLTRLFGDKVIDDLVICGSDPFLDDGTDISVIFSLKNSQVFNMNTARYFSSAKTEFPAFKEETLKLGDSQVYALTTSDRKLHSFSCEIGSFKIYSNSRRAMEMIIDASKERIPSLSRAPDMRYMRTIFPPDSEKEDFFLYLSDRHIRNIVGPSRKIARQRQIQCLNSLRILQNSVTFAMMEKEADPVNIEVLKGKKYLRSSYLRCPDGGNYMLLETGEPGCSFHGIQRFLRPVLESLPSRITESEKRDYETFVKEYNTYWSRFFDPVGIRGKTGNLRISLETCILPLIENSAYNSFRSLTGGSPEKMEFPIHPKTIFQIMGKINFDEEDKIQNEAAKFVNEVALKGNIGAKDLVKAFGNSFSMNFVDSDLRFYFEFGQGEMIPIGIFRDAVGSLIGGFFVTALNLPVYAAFPVRDEKVVDEFIRNLLANITAESARYNARSSFSFGSTVFCYDSTDLPSKTRIYGLDLKFFILKLHLFLAVHDGFLLIASQKRIIPEIIQNFSEKTKTESNLEVRVLFENFKTISETSRLSWQEKIRTACLGNFGSVNSVFLYHKIDPENCEKDFLRINGFLPVCPAGGKYGINKVSNTVMCSIHGDSNIPHQPPEIEETSPIHKFMNSLKMVSGSLAFTPEGVMTKVEIK